MTVEPVEVRVPSLGGCGQPAHIVVGPEAAAVRVGDRACYAPQRWVSRDELAEVLLCLQRLLDGWPEPGAAP